MYGGWWDPGMARERPGCQRTALLHPTTSVSPTGFFFEPTVFTDVEDHMFIAKEESFGPIMIISRFADG